MRDAAALWTSPEAQAATGGVATDDFVVTGVSIDTRSLQPGDLFVALKAARDGHDFVAQAFDNGAAAALVDHVPEGVSGPCLVVPDVLEALTALGAAGRERSAARVIAVTGSVGKTSTKEMLRDMLAMFGTVHAAEASFNNHWGVPITLARLPRGADYAVVEIGMNHPGEIEPLARLTRPHVAMITTVAPAHMEAFGAIEGIAHEKAAIFAGLEADGWALYNSDVETAPILAKAARDVAGPRVRSFGQAGDIALKGVRNTATALVIEAQMDGHDLLVRLRDSGRHFALNALGCLGVAAALDLDLALAAQALSRWQPPAGRGRRETLVLDEGVDARFTLIDDAFNANPTSLEAALDVLAAQEPGPGGRRIAILGDMLELGASEAEAHRAIACHPALDRIALVHCVGPRMAHLWRALASGKQGLCVDTADHLVAKAHSLVHPSDVVLVKGSKGSYVSRVVEALRRLGTAESDDLA